MIERAKLEALQRAAKAQEELAESAKQPIIFAPQPVFIGPPFPFRHFPDTPHRRDPPQQPASQQQPLSRIQQR